MRAWGAGIFQDDFAVDLRDRFEERVSQGNRPGDAAIQVFTEHGVSDKN